ncbi:GntR family transcriptional regulator [Thermocatellispora tengchongensis]|uniref:GntR family transcriptional regulator n=1 Tax=Thermocatellispora tengchongensis TaxID=1073253 RepID=A0A840PRG2_9ACTN|nr:GntR family transcriptional regulator [Thermocatellispora tengchongensis]MBB5138555.1 GntR family transcriptional regulator [Thermocatellispora tengchongensis]
MSSRATGIDRSSPLPLYYQLKSLLLDQIGNGVYAPGDRLPGDHELCARYDVSRTVVRQALAELELEGLIHRVRGRGTYVSPPKAAQGLVQSLTGLHEEVTHRGATLRSDVRALEIVPAPGPVAAELRIPPGSPVVFLERVRYVDEEPWVYTTTYIPASVAPGLETEDLTLTSLYDLLEHKYGVALSHGHRSLEALLSTPEIDALLGIGPRAPLLVLRSVSYDETGRAVETFVSYNRADRTRFEVDVARAPRS